MQTLKFSTGNGKLRNRLIFSLPAGYSCPHAGVCRTYADRVTGKITDIPNNNGTDAKDFRCFAAMRSAGQRQGSTLAQLGSNPQDHV